MKARPKLPRRQHKLASRSLHVKAQNTPTHTEVHKGASVLTHTPSVECVSATHCPKQTDGSMLSIKEPLVPACYPCRTVRSQGVCVQPTLILWHNCCARSPFRSAATQARGNVKLPAPCPSHKTVV